MSRRVRIALVVSGTTLALCVVALAVIFGVRAFDGRDGRGPVLEGAVRSAADKILADRALETSAVTALTPRTSTAVKGAFDTAAAIAHIRALERIGVRVGGTEGEKRAAEYLAEQLRSFGYEVEVREFPLTNGRTSRNVVAVLEGTTKRRVVVGAHYDTKSPSPGANDNGSGTAAVLVMAEELADERLAPTIEFVLFGTEELIDANPDHHHFGSRFHAASMSAAEREATVAMFSVDMIGYGPQFVARTMGKGPQTLRDDIVAFSKSRGRALTYLKDPGSSGWSDHEAFELAGIPSVWIEWRDDPVYHTAGDVTAHLQTAKIGAAGGLVLEYLRAMDEERMARLRP